MSDIYNKFKSIGEYAAAGLYENKDRNLFYRKAVGLRRYFENCSLPIYRGEKLYPSGKIIHNTMIYPSYLNGLDIDYFKFLDKDKALTETFVGEFCRFKSTIPQEHTVGGNMWVHSMPNYERILKEGMSSYEKRINKISDEDIREGLLELMSGIKQYHSRCITYLKSVNACSELITALENVPFNPAENIYEAVVAWNFILYLDNCDNLGCIADGLSAYYHGEDIVDLLQNIYDNLDINEGFSMALQGDDNPLVIQCLEASKGKRRPMIELLIDENTPGSVWEKAFEVIRTNNGQPAFYNKKVIFDGLKNKFPSIRNEDIKKFCGGGCTESMLAGLSHVGSLDAGINLAFILHEFIHKELLYASDFEEFYNKFISFTKKETEKVIKEINNCQKLRSEVNPLPMRTLLIDDCIDNGIEYNSGGARYKWSIINFAGLINVIDSMLIIRDWVFIDKIYTPQMFIRLLSENDDMFLDKAKKYRVCFGVDDEKADKFANKISKDIFSILDDKKPYLGMGFLPASIQFNSAAVAGEKIGATPDGRKSGEPLCESLGAVFSKDTEGPTALLNSVSSLDLKRALGIPVLNFTINPKFDDDIFKALILGYMDKGGIHMQVTCITREMLSDAYENPEKYKNLVVRVGGYSEYFNNLSDDLKKLIISRMIY